MLPRSDISFPIKQWDTPRRKYQCFSLFILPAIAATDRHSPFLKTRGALGLELSAESLPFG